MKSPKVSVIIPVYNTQPWLKECLDSVLRQTMADFEVICVDDGSTDQSGAVLQEYAAKDARFSVFSQSNQGQSAARNAGIKIARGQYIYFLDSDDYIEPDLPETVCRRLDNENLDIVFFDVHVFGEKGIQQEFVNQKNKRYILSRDYPAVFTGEDLLCSFLENGDYRCSVCKQVVRKELLTIHQLSFYEGIINEDDLYTFQVMMLARRAAYIHRILFHRRLRLNSTVTKPLAFQNPYGYYVCIKEAYLFLLRQNCDTEKKKLLFPVLKKWAASARGEYLQLMETDQEKVEQLPEEEKLLFQLCISDYANRVKIIENSRSFKIGRMVTFIPRKLRNWLRCR